jgi:release factor glutamine methyltransferase
VPATERPAGERPAAVTWAALFRRADAVLEDRQVARWLVEDASGGTFPHVLDEPVTERAGRYFESMLGRRAQGEPLQYVLGHWSFRRLDLMVDRRVLIPRPETEVVVDIALAELRRVGGGPLTAVDLGTGSGAIALSLALEQPNVQVWATDISEDALAVASANLAGVGSAAGGRARFLQGSWWSALPGELAGAVELVVSNPPYVSASELAELSAEVRDFEPHGALVPGPSGLEALAHIISGAPHWLSARGSLVCEMAPHQASEALAMAGAAGFADAFVRQDLAGRDRALVARMA